MAWQEPKTDWDSAGNPLPADFNRIEGNIQVLQDNKINNAGGTPAILSDLIANRPAAGVAGRLFLATDTGALYRDTGTSWVTIVREGAQPGNTILLEALTERTVTDTGSEYREVKRFVVPYTGKYRITGETRSSDSGSYTYYQISTSIETLNFYTTNSYYTSFTKDLTLPIAAGSIISIRARATIVIAYIRNVRLCYAPAMPPYLGAVGLD